MDLKSQQHEILQTATCLMRGDDVELVKSERSYCTQAHNSAALQPPINGLIPVAMQLEV